MAEQFGDRLRALRDKAKETQPQLAGVLKVNTTTISRWERNKGMPHSGQIRALAKHYGVSPDHLLLGTSQETPLDSDVFAQFLATKWGRIAQDNGWLEAIRTWKHTTPPTVDLYVDFVMALMRHQERTEKDS